MSFLAVVIAPVPFYFNFIFFVHIGHANFDFNLCSIIAECCFYPQLSVTKINMDFNNDEINEEVTTEFIKCEALKLTQEGHITSIKTGDYHFYYLLKLSKNAYRNESVV